MCIFSFNKQSTWHVEQPRYPYLEKHSWWNPLIVRSFWLVHVKYMDSSDSFKWTFFFKIWIYIIIPLYTVRKKNTNTKKNSSWVLFIVLKDIPFSTSQLPCISTWSHFRAVFQSSSFFKKSDHGFGFYIVVM